MVKPLEFIQNVYAAAQAAQCQSGMFASVTIAQAFLETGYGNSMPVDVNTGEISYNMFGIKAAAGQPYVVSLTREVYKTLPSKYERYTKLPNGKYEVYIYANFRKFKDYTECFLGRSVAFVKSKYWKKATTTLRRKKQCMLFSIRAILTRMGPRLLMQPIHNM
jgi:flagellum-specific peptidoglycan hydrolase FlgJ